MLSRRFGQLRSMLLSPTRGLPVWMLLGSLVVVFVPGLWLGAGSVSVGERALVGAGTVIVPGVMVGPGATVGAGSVVLGDIGRDATAVGAPARIIETC